MGCTESKEASSHNGSQEALHSAKHSKRLCVLYRQVKRLDKAKICFGYSDAELKRDGIEERKVTSMLMLGSGEAGELPS